AGEVGMEAQPELEQGRGAALDVDLALGRAGRAGQDLEQRALVGAVETDHADRFAFRHRELDPAQGPERLVPDHASCRHPLPQTMRGTPVAPIGLAQTPDRDDAHSSSTIAGARRRKTLSEIIAKSTATTTTGHS